MRVTPLRAGSARDLVAITPTDPRILLLSRIICVALPLFPAWIHAYLCLHKQFSVTPLWRVGTTPASALLPFPLPLITDYLFLCLPPHLCLWPRLCATAASHAGHYCLRITHTCRYLALDSLLLRVLTFTCLPLSSLRVHCAAPAAAGTGCGCVCLPLALPLRIRAPPATTAHYTMHYRHRLVFSAVAYCRPRLHRLCLY